MDVPQGNEYIDIWARRMWDLDKERLQCMSEAGLTEYVGGRIAFIVPDERDIEAICLALRQKQRDNAPPSDDARSAARDAMGGRGLPF